MLRFLSQVIQKNKKSLLFVTTTALTIGVGVWTFDLLKLVPTGTLPPLTQWQVRILLTLILVPVWLLSLLAITLASYRKQIKAETDKQPDNKIETNKKETLEEQFNRSILLHILKLRGLNQIASPKNIANQMKQDSGIILAHLWKLHNEQFVTFITGGLPPTQDTDFFLSPKAFEIIDIEDTQQVNQGDG